MRCSHSRYRTVLFSLIALVQLDINAQVLKGIIKSEKGNPIAYANIGIPGKNIGTCSDPNGEFSIDLRDAVDVDTVIFSSLGYKKEEIPVSDLIKGEPYSIILKERILELKELVINGSRGFKEKYVGNKTGKNYGRMVGKNGGALAAKKFNTGKRVMWVGNVGIFTAHRGEEEMKLRVRLYQVDDGGAFEELLTQNVFVDVTKGTGWSEVDLTPFNVEVEGQFLVGFEWLDGNFQTPLVAIGGRSKNSYYRLVSEGPMQQIYDMNWSIKATLFEEK